MGGGGGGGGLPRVLLEVLLEEQVTQGAFLSDSPYPERGQGPFLSQLL